MKSVIVDVQGFKTKDNEFILKEIAILSEDQMLVFLVQPPYPFQNLTNEEKKQVKWIERNRKVLWNDGFIPYESVYMYIVNFIVDKMIYCKGVEKMQWIKNILSTDNVTNLETMNCPNLLSLYERYRNSSDIFNCIYHPTICALKNVTCLKKWCIDNKIL